MLEAEEVALLDEYVALLQPVLREVKAQRGVSEALAPGYTGAAPLRPGFNVSRRACTPGQRRRRGRGGTDAAAAAPLAAHGPVQHLPRPPVRLLLG